MILKTYMLFIFIFLILLLIKNAASGFDMSDESHYIINAIQSKNIVGQPSQFGYITGVILSYCSNNIEYFRITGIFLILFSALLFIISLNEYWSSWTFNTDKYSTNTHYWTIMPALISALVYYHLWLITPSYNWLALIASLLTGSGLFISSIKKHSNTFNNYMTFNPIYLGSVLIGLGLALSFLAKPSTTLALGLICALWLIFHFKSQDKVKFVLISLTVFISFIYIHIIINFENHMKFYQRLSVGLEIMNTLNDNSALSLLVTKPIIQFIHLFSQLVKSTVFIVGILVVLLLTLAIRYKQYVQSFSELHNLIMITVIGFTIAIIYNMGGLDANNIAPATIAGSLFMLLSIGMIKTIHLDMMQNNPIPLTRMLIIYVVLIMLAISVSYGTGRPIIKHASCAYIFLGLSVSFLSRWIITENKDSLLHWIFPAFVCFSSTIVLISAFNNPYRLTSSISKQTSPISFMATSGILKVNSITAIYVKKLKSDALNAGWKRRLPLIDLTGVSPGATLILDAEILAKPWFLGGFINSNKFALKVLSFSDPKKIRQAWILVAPNGKSKLSPAILLKYNLKFPENYEMVSQLKSGWSNEKQELWRPKQVSLY